MPIKASGILIHQGKTKTEINNTISKIILFIMFGLYFIKSLLTNILSVSYFTIDETNN
jgi:hypothetical protein